MKKLLALLISLILVFELPMPMALASFDDQIAGARAPGMADSFTAVADDADAIVYNPAGLIQLQEGQISSQYGQLVKGLDDGSSLNISYLGYAHPLVRGYRTLGFAYSNFKGDNLFNERTLTLSYGQRLDLDRYGWRGIYSFGGNVKQLHREYLPDRFAENALNDAGIASNQKDSLFSSGNAKDTFAFDLGTLAQFGPKYQYTAGVALINLNQPDVSLGGDGDKAPLAVKMGVGYRPRWGSVTAESRRVTRLAGQTDSDLAFGIERNIPFASVGALVVRGGYASGSRGYKALTTGLSYLYSRFRLDYAFSFPIGNLADTTGSQHVGFSVKLGSGGTQLGKDYSNSDLLVAFAYNSLTTHVLLTRLSFDRNLPPDLKDQLMLLLLRKYPLDDKGLSSVKEDMRNILQRYANNLSDWSRLKFMLIQGVPDEEKGPALEALEFLVKNDAKSALARLALLSPTIQRGDRISALKVMALGELAASTYRREELDPCIDNVRRLLEIMPTDEVVTRAYRDLLARRARISDHFNESTGNNIKLKEELPEAPQTLVAPHPTEETVATPEQTKMSDRDALIRAFGTSLGYYLMRKSQGAGHDELVSLLNQMRIVYGGAGIDMALVDAELADLNKTAPATAPVVAPVKETPAKVVPKQKAKKATAAPTPKPTVTPVEKPKAAPASKAPANTELERAWTYYQDAAARDISDHEKLELLQDMLTRFGEQGAGRINKELERIRKRLER